jgi:hypothetical protein
MKDDLLSYFRSAKGKIISVSDGKAIADVGEKSQIRRGMRFTVFREGTSFLHPVTKEPLGVLESVIGKVEVKDVGMDTSTTVVLKGDVRAADKIRISETEVRMLFYQQKNIDWSLADAYFRLLKETGRFELIDTAVEANNEEEIIAEAKRVNADVVLVVSSTNAGEDVMFRQKLLWVDAPLTIDKGGFAESEARIASVFMKELKFGEEFFGPQKAEALYVDIPFGVRFIATGDVEGDGKIELLMSTGKDIRLYMPGELDILYEIKGSASDDHLYLDAMDLNRNGRTEVIITYMKDNTIISRIYELKDAKFSMMWEGNMFLRRMGNELFAQAYEAGEGYKGPVFEIIWNDGYKKGNNIELPKGVNIYDFVFIESEGKKLILAYDDANYLNLYDRGSRIWQSKEDYGGFITTFKRTTPTVMLDKGEWSVKDRIIQLSKEAFIIKRIPLSKVARGLGYGKSQLKSLWWTGVSMEERNVTDYISGSMLDYAFAGDRLIVLGKPVLGIKFKNIIKGESPIGSMLYIYSMKGR